jgi:hypothetical protein
MLLYAALNEFDNDNTVGAIVLTGSEKVQNPFKIDECSVAQISFHLAVSQEQFFPLFGYQDE